METLLVVVLVTGILYALSSFQRPGEPEVIYVQVERQAQHTQIGCLPFLMVGILILVGLALLGS